MQAISEVGSRQEISPRASATLKAAATVVVWSLAVLNLYYFRIADADLWWYLRCGEDILQSGQIKQVDTYTFTAGGLPFLNHEWLAHILLAWLFQHGGAAALVGLKMIVGVALLLVFWRLLRLHSEDPRIYLPLFLLGAHAVGRFLLFRPQIFTFLFFTIVLTVLEFHRRKPTHAIWFLPALMWLWANLHAAFAVGIAAIGYYWLVLPWTGPNPAKRVSKQLGLVLLVSCMATLINPYGISLWQCVLQTSLDPLLKKYVEEWQPLWFAPLTWNSVLFLAMACLMAGSALLGRARHFGDVVLVSIFAFLGLSAPRHIPLFAIVALPFTCGWLGEWAAHQTESRKPNLVLAGLLGLVLVPALLTSWYTLGDLRPRIRVVDAHYRGFPYQAVEFLRRQPASGNIWNELAWGGYLMWTLSPQWKVSLDGRNLNVYPTRVLRDHFELFASQTPDLSVLERYPIDVCLIRPERKLAGALEASSRWEVIYRDDKAVIFRSRGSTLTNLVVQKEMILAAPPHELFLPR